MKCTELFETIDSLFDKYLDVLDDLCRIESPTADKARVDAVGEYVMNIARAHGWKIEVHEEKISGNAIAITMNPDAKGAPFALSAHMDTVHPVGLFGPDPVRRDETNMYGPGTLDCKAGIAQSLLTMEALEKCGFRERPVILLLQSDEEVGSRTSEKRTVKFMCDAAKDAVAFINLEGSSPGYACLTRKGIVYFTFNVKGIAAHASKCAKEGASAIAEAAYKILELEKLKDNDGITCNCGTISGGTVPNTVPAECTFCVNIRYVNQEQLDWVTEYVHKVADTNYIPGCTTTVKQTGMRVAMELVERNVALLERSNEIFRECGLSELKLGKGVGGSDAADVTSYGIPCMDSLSASGGGIHAVGEYINIESLRDATRRTAALVYCI